MPDYLLSDQFKDCTPLFVLGSWWLCSADVAVVLGISPDSVSKRVSSGRSLCSLRSLRFHGLRLWDASEIALLAAKRDALRLF